MSWNVVFPFLFSTAFFMCALFVLSL